MMHRIEVFDDGVLCDSAESIAGQFRAHPEWLGTPDMPYPLIVTTSGGIEQACPLTTVTPHAWKWNERALAVGWVGDFRTSEPTNQQAACANIMLPILVQAFGFEADNLVGHTEPGLEKATRHPEKVCPGKHMDPVSLRRLVEVGLQAKARETLREAGMVF